MSRQSISIAIFTILFLGVLVLPTSSTAQIVWSPDPIIYQRQIALLVDYVRQHPSLMARLYRFTQTTPRGQPVSEGLFDRDYPTKPATEESIVPMITSLSPTSGTFGTKIIINGVGFDEYNNYIQTTYGLINGLASADGRTLTFILRQPSDEGLVLSIDDNDSDSSGQEYSDYQGLLTNEKTIPVMVGVENIFGQSNTVEFTLVP